MKFLLLQIVLGLFSTGMVLSDEPANPIDKRYVDIAAAEKIEDADVKWLASRLAHGGIDKCIAVALLFRADPKQYADDTLTKPQFVST